MGIGGLPPFPKAGPITALRVLRHGFAVAVDPQRTELSIGRDGPPSADIRLPLTSISRTHAALTRVGTALEVADRGSKNGVGRLHSWGSDEYVRCESTLVNVGDRFALGDVHLLALDELTHQLTLPLSAYCGLGGDDDVDRSLEAVARGHMIVLQGNSGDQLAPIAYAIHNHSTRRDYPFTYLKSLPTSDEAIDDLCTKAACGTIFLDLTIPFALPLRFSRHLFGCHFHLGAIVATNACTDHEAMTCFGQAAIEPKRLGFGLCALGFPRHGWNHHGAITFSSIS
jgi:hypothetical protein